MDSLPLTPLWTKKQKHKAEQQTILNPPTPPLGEFEPKDIQTTYSLSSVHGKEAFYKCWKLIDIMVHTVKQKTSYEQKLVTSKMTP